MPRSFIVVTLLAVELASFAQTGPPPGGRQFPPGQQIRVERIDSKYAVAPGGTKGRFVTGQDADLMLGGIGFNNSGGPLLFNHPSGLASDGNRLLLSDRWNNRVLIWTKLPTGNTPPDLVLGQKDFITNNPGMGRHELNWPGNVTITPDGTRIAVVDTNNDRALIWNSFPQKSGAAADIVIELQRLPLTPNPSPTRGEGRVMRLGWPWGVWTDGKKLAVVCTHGSCVLIWNTLPKNDNAPPDFMLTPRGCGTPRNVTSDSMFFMLSDHNYGDDSRPATLVWRTWPTSPTQEPDFVWREWMKGTLTPDRKLILAGMQSLFFWNSMPRSDDDPALALRPDAYRNGDGPDVVVAAGRMYVCNYNGCNVLVWNRVPTQPNTPPDFALGADDARSNVWDDNFFIQNPIPATNGQSLFISSDFNRKMFVWRKLPNESGAKPDLVYHLSDAPWDNALHGETLVLAGKETVTAWRKLPLNGEEPDVVIRGGLGDVRFAELTGVALDDKYLYLADRQADCVYVFDNSIVGRSLPAAAGTLTDTASSRNPPNDAPKFILSFQRPGRLSSDGTYLCVCPFDAPNVAIYRVADLQSGQPLISARPGTFNLPGKCLVAKGHLFVANTSFNRVHVWHRIDDALAGKPADALLGASGYNDTKPEIGRNQLFMPGAIAFDGSYVWVTEFKFSTRVLRFSPRSD